MQVTRIGLTLFIGVLCVGSAVGQTQRDEAAQRWRNVVYDPSRYDAEMTAIDSMVDLENVEERTHHIRALISRFDAVAHYRAEENLTLLAKAIGSGI